MDVTLIELYQCVTQDLKLLEATNTHNNIDLFLTVNLYLHLTALAAHNGQVKKGNLLLPCLK